MKKTRNVVAYLVITIVFIYVAFTLTLFLGFDDWNKSGTFGDSFGVLNTLFSGIALTGVIYTLHLQVKTLELQRRDQELSISPMIALESVSNNGKFKITATNVGNGTALYVRLEEFSLGNGISIMSDTCVCLKAGESKELYLFAYENGGRCRREGWFKNLYKTGTSLEYDINVSYLNTLKDTNTQRFRFDLMNLEFHMF